MEALDCIIDAAQCRVSDDIPTDEITKFNECTESVYDIIGDITFYCCNVNLMDLVMKNEKNIQVGWMNLHQCL